MKMEHNVTKNICYGCLSPDRKVEPLINFVDLFNSLCRFQISRISPILLCWECKCLLKKIWRFQQRIQNAQLLLEECKFQLNELNCLSTLKLTQTENYDFIGYSQDNGIGILNAQIKHEYTTDDFNDSSNLKEENIDEESIVNQSYVSENEAEGLPNDGLHSNKEEVTMKETDYIKTELGYGGSKKRKEHNKKFRRRCFVTKNGINFNNICQYFTKYALNEKVMEEVLEQAKNITYRRAPRFACKICSISIHKGIDLKRHSILKHPPPYGPYKCTECRNSRKFSFLVDLHEHWRDHHIFKCKQCPEVCRTQREMMDHIKDLHQYTYQCKSCQNLYSTFREFFRHYRDLHEKFICDHCGKTYIKKYVLERHIKRRHLPPTCGSCGRTFKTSGALKSHSHLYHPELHYDVSKPELSYCVECNKQFNSIYTYKRHLNTATIHRPPQPVRVPCPECAKVFTRKSYMTNHYKLFHTKKSKHYCEICDKYFVTAYTVRNHRQTVHEKTLPPKNKICEICGRGFSTNRMLIHHTRTHTGEKPFKCSQCPAAFAQNCAKKSHERSQHKIFS